jgi:hypothetical protein
MTEAEWLACTEPQKMLEFLRDKCSRRKMWMFDAACCRRCWHLLNVRSRNAVEVTELYLETTADGIASAGAWFGAVRTAAGTAARLGSSEPTVQAALLRDIFNPFRPVSLAPAVLTWHDSTVVRLARAAYDQRHLPDGTLDNGRLAVLADALEEAGCQDQDILSHCRSGGEHVRGCWVVDLILGKTPAAPAAKPRRRLA